MPRGEALALPLRPPAEYVRTEHSSGLNLSSRAPAQSSNKGPQKTARNHSTNSAAGCYDEFDGAPLKGRAFGGESKLGARRGRLTRSNSGSGEQLGASLKALRHALRHRNYPVGTHCCCPPPSPACITTPECTDEACQGDAIAAGGRTSLALLIGAGTLNIWIQARS